ncbi:hypothetical protein EAI05_13685 [Bacillus subtilis]|uniref:hypothetical protein n=1 Tax=Bacillus subtilis TaxID=1423 RepID=UPI000F098AB4|nr:hypothetical protein [Bacillus subtilis]MCV2517421.1 hypothetical protein [Bacillus subtilis]QHJ99274.1 hypothetical protein C7M17_02377 [Bacillus subtilis]RNA71678.1 hypothetical protein EAI05_13685 [Bacillus subtilis]WIY65185.1 hypothetical protein QM004_19510 [Bacillus subtilis]
MDVKKCYQLLTKLYDYGEVDYHNSMSFLKLEYLLEQKQDRYIITNNWITYGRQFQSEQDQLLSIFCFNEDYQKYLVEVALSTALKMSETEDLEGIENFVSNLSKLSSYIISVLAEIKENSWFSITRLEDRLKQKEEQFQDFNRLIFDGPPHYQRVMFYLKLVQAYKQENVIEDIDLGKKIDEQWKKGRKISTDLSLAPLKERPLHTLVPYIPERKIDHPQFQHIFTYPWKLFVFLCCIVRENFEAQGVQAIRFQVVGDGVDVLLTASNHQQFRYGSFDEFAIEFCKINQYQLFPYELRSLHTIFQNLVERKLLTVVDDEYRLPTTIEDVIYHTRLFIPLIAESKQLRARLEQWIDELREKR